MVLNVDTGQWSACAFPVNDLRNQKNCILQTSGPLPETIALGKESFCFLMPLNRAFSESQKKKKQ